MFGVADDDGGVGHALAVKLRLHVAVEAGGLRFVQKLHCLERRRRRGLRPAFVVPASADPVVNKRCPWRATGSIGRVLAQPSRAGERLRRHKPTGQQERSEPRHPQLRQAISCVPKWRESVRTLLRGRRRLLQPDLRVGVADGVA